MIDTSALFLHVLAAIGIVGGGGAQVLSGQRLRRATTADEVVLWARFTRTVGLVVAASAAVSLLTGGHLAAAVWTTDTRSGFAEPFITLGVAALVLLAPVGPMVGGRRLRRLTELAAEDGPASRGVVPSLIDAARSPVLWGAVHSLLGVGIGLVALMVYKPGWAAGGVLLLGSFLAGAASGVVAARGAHAAPPR